MCEHEKQPWTEHHCRNYPVRAAIYIAQLEAERKSDLASVNTMKAELEKAEQNSIDEILAKCDKCGAMRCFAQQRFLTNPPSGGSILGE